MALDIIAMAKESYDRGGIIAYDSNDKEYNAYVAFVVYKGRYAVAQADVELAAMTNDPIEFIAAEIKAIIDHIESMDG